ncbi:MAG: hypothetical protein J0J15_30225 [Mesorhizobium sp.]|nr:hypothetical protein [Mesorhizobium sp.]
MGTIGVNRQSGTKSGNGAAAGTAMAGMWLVAGCLAAATPSRRTRHAELLRLCARIGYSPPPLS